MTALLGTIWRFTTVGGGTFHCPRCDAGRDYTGTRARPFLSFFDRAVVPLSGERTLIACDACGAVYDASVTTMDPAAARVLRSEDQLALEAVLAAMVVSDSTIREVEKVAVQQAVRHHTGRRPTDVAGAVQRLDTTRRRAVDPFERIERIAGALDERTRRRILAAAYRVGAADREMHPQEARLLIRLGEVLDLHPRQVREAMKEGRA